MNKTIPIALNAMRVAGVGAIALGLLLWAEPGWLTDVQLGAAFGVHRPLGIIAVLALWVLSAAGLSRDKFRLRAVLLFVLGLAVAGLGMTQAFLLPGPQHWIVRALHFLLGVVALRQGEVLARLLRGQRVSPLPLAGEGQGEGARDAPAARS